MWRNGYVVLTNERQWKRWARNAYLLPCAAPSEYPCIAESRVDVHEDSYPFYVYRSTVAAMSKALVSAQGAANSAQQAKPAITPPTTGGKEYGTGG
jgi:hypothetical protein